jgi:hypothetical protein
MTILSVVKQSDLGTEEKKQEQKYIFVQTVAELFTLIR